LGQLDGGYIAINAPQDSQGERLPHLLPFFGGVMFAKLLTGPRINAGFITPSHGLFLTCRGEKYIQYYTILYNVQYLKCRVFKCKIHNLGCGPQCKGANFPLLRSHAENQLPRFSQAIRPAPSPSPPLQAHIPKHVIQFELAEDDISTSKFLLIHYK
jgi:hypothetical protein